VEVKSVGVLRCGIVLAILYAIVGVLEGLFMLFVAAVAPVSAGGSKVFSVGLAIAFPVLALVGGFIGGVVIAWLYNLIAGWVGGVQLHLVPIAEAEQKY
jgi:hypothetical protein